MAFGLYVMLRAVQSKQEVRPRDKSTHSNKKDLLICGKALQMYHTCNRRVSHKIGEHYTST